MPSYKKLIENEINKLSETGQDLFHHIYSFGKNENITNFVNAWMLEDPMQDLKDSNIWSNPAIFFRQPFFSQRNQQST